jgi:hypothetical protein
MIRITLAPDREMPSRKVRMLLADSPHPGYVPGRCAEGAA